VHLALATKQILEAKGYATRVVSMVSWEVFAQQEEAYRQKIIDRKTIRVSIEMGSTFGWERYTGDDGLNLGINHFGESAPGNIVIEKFGFSPEQVSEKVLSFVKKNIKL
jgi:transketolase